MIYVSDKKAKLCKGDFRPAQFYKGKKKIAGYERASFEGERNVYLENCYNDRLYNAKIHGNENGVGDVVSEGENAGKHQIGVIARGKNIYKPTRLSAGAIYNSSTKPITSSNHGTTISTTDATQNEFVVTQTKATSSTAQAYQNGYFCIEVGQGVLTAGKTYKISFDCEILDSLIDTNSIGIMPNGANLSLGTVVNGRVSVNFIYMLNSERDNYLEVRVCGHSLKIKNIMITDAYSDAVYEPYTEPQKFNIYLDSPLQNGEQIDFDNGKVVRKDYEEEMELPVLPTTKGTTVIEVDTQVAARISGEYKRMEE